MIDGDARIKAHISQLQAALRDTDDVHKNRTRPLTEDIAVGLQAKPVSVT